MPTENPPRYPAATRGRIARHTSVDLASVTALLGRDPVPLSTIIALKVPLVGQSVHAGFPSPADDFIEDMIDLNQVLVQNPTATFLWRVVGDCMIDVKIFPGDVVVVDRSLTPRHRSVVLAIIDSEPTLKRLNRRGGHMVLHNENAKLPTFTIAEGTEVSIWGVVTATIRQLAK